MSAVRRIPMRLPPLPGEALDGWLLAYAHRLDTTVADLLAQAGAEPAMLPTLPRELARGADPALVRQLGQVTGHAVDALAAMTEPLRTYWSVVQATTSAPGRRFLTQVLASSRYCPPCLAESNGRWKSGWRLPWVVACPVHRVLLAASCPVCRRLPRQRAFTRQATPIEPHRCAEPALHATGRSPARCGADLALAACLPADPAVVELAQAWDGYASAPTMHGATQLSILIHDVAVLLAANAAEASRASIASALSDPEGFARALGRPAEAALHPEGEVFAHLALAGHEQAARPLPAGWTHVSPPLATKAMSIRDQHLGVLDRIRWSTTTQGQRPHLDVADMQRRAARLPSALWADWTVRLMPTGLRSGAVFPAAAIGAVLLRGSSMPMREAMGLISEDAIDIRSAARAMGEVGATPHADTVLRVLTQLSQALDATHPSPIDYHRRRQLASASPLLSQRQWRDICATTGTSVGGPRRRTFARLRVWELLTGGLPRQAPEPLRPDVGEPLHGYYDFLRRQPPTVLNALREHATDLLAAWHVDEPLTWTPPLDCLPTSPTHWPGLDVEALPSSTWSAALSSDTALGQSAAVLGIDLHQARIAITLEHFATVSTHAERRPSPIDDASLRDAVVTRGMPLRQAATELGIDRKRIAQRCREIGIDLSSPGRRQRWHIDPEWLREQYLQRMRPLPDIAQEIGCSPTSLARIAQQHGITLRGRGGSSHRSATLANQELPALLAACMRGQGGPERVERFVALSSAQTLTQAAKELEVTQPVLTTQLRRLEAAAGGQLIIRADPQRGGLHVTPLGRRLIKEAVNHLGLDAPVRPSQPLADAIGSFRGRERVAKLAVAVHHPTLRSAAQAVGVSPGSLRRSIRGLEDRCGELTTGLDLDQPVRLNRLGKRLLSQWHDRPTPPQ